MHDVLEQVIGIGRGDEALHAVDVPRAVGLLHGLGTSGADIGTGVRLGQHHGRAPATLGGQQGPLLLLLGSEVVEDVGEAGAHRVHVDRRVGAQDVFLQRPGQCAGHRHTTEFLGDAELVPAAVDDNAHRLLESLGQRDAVGLRVEYRGVAVALGERFGHRALGQARHLAQHLDGGVDVQVGELALTHRLVDFENLEQIEYLVTDIALVVAHGSSSMRTPHAVGYSGQVTHQ